MYLPLNIKHLRELNNLTQIELAEKLGTKPKNIGNYEQGKANPQIELLVQMASILGATVEDMVSIDLSDPYNPKKIDKNILNNVDEVHLKVPLSVPLNDANDKKRYLTEQLNEPTARYNISRIKSKNILVPIKAQAGYMHDYTQDNNQEFEYIHIPNVHGEARTFEIEGDSMYPYFQHGDYAVCTQVEHTIGTLQSRVNLLEGEVKEIKKAK